MIELNDLSVNPRRDWREWFKALILLGLGLYFIVLIVTDNLSNYINLRFMWLSYVAVGLFVLLGGWSALRLLRGSQQLAYATSTAHVPITWLNIALVSIPLVLATLIPSQPLGAEAVTGGISLEPIGGASAEASYRIPPEERNVLDWLREYNSVQNPAELNGLPVDIVGFVYREPDMSEGQFMVARFTVSCCVADAFAVGLPVQVAGQGDLADGAWVRVRGTLQAGSFRGEQVPIIIPESVEPVPEPATPYLYS